MTSVAGLTGTLAYTTGDFTLSAWVTGDATILTCQVAGGGVVTFSTVGGVLRFTDGTDTIQAAMSGGAGWSQVAFVRSGTSLDLYENGRLITTGALTAVRAYGGTATAGVGTTFDIRRNTKVVSSDAMQFYYDSIIDGGGGFLP